MNAAHQPIRYYQVSATNSQIVEAEIISETAVTLTVNGEVWLSLMCTPTDLEAMAVGFLFNEGLIQSSEEIASVRLCPTGDNIDVWINRHLEKPTMWRRTSGCTGGFTSTDACFEGQGSPTPNGSTLSVSQLGTLIGMLLDQQELYRNTGGVHTSALSDGESLLVVTEDIGRHNTLDKIAGRCLLETIFPSCRILLTTGRISSEMMQKASCIGASIVISRTAPSSLSIHLAQRWGITLIGYARRNSFRVYTHPERVRNLFRPPKHFRPPAPAEMTPGAKLDTEDENVKQESPSSID